MNHKKYIDLHTHTRFSDGQLTPQELIQRAKCADIGTLAITDHNTLIPNLDELRKSNPDMELITASEISCRYTTSDNQDVEVHLVALMIDPEEESMAHVFRTNQPDRRPYINEILDKLRSWNIDLGSYDDLKKRHPDAGYLGRMAVAADMVRFGYAKDVDEAFDVYLGGGADQQKLAYVPNPLKYVTLDEAVPAIEKTGLCVLAHLWYYSLSPEENHRLLARFKELGGTAMEVEYRRYNRAQRDELRILADSYNLLYSAASDFHGQNESDSLDNRFPHEIWEKLKTKHGQR